MIQFLWGPRWRLFIGLVLMAALVAALYAEVTFYIPETMLAKTCSEWAFKNLPTIYGRGLNQTVLPVFNLTAEGAAG